MAEDVVRGAIFLIRQGRPNPHFGISQQHHRTGRNIRLPTCVLASQPPASPELVSKGPDRPGPCAGRRASSTTMPRQASAVSSWSVLPLPWSTTGRMASTTWLQNSAGGMSMCSASRPAARMSACTTASTSTSRPRPPGSTRSSACCQISASMSSGSSRRSPSVQFPVQRFGFRGSRVVHIRAAINGSFKEHRYAVCKSHATAPAGCPQPVTLSDPLCHFAV